MASSRKSSNQSGVWKCFTVPDTTTPYNAECSECSATIRRGKPGAAPKDYQVIYYIGPLDILTLLDIIFVGYNFRWTKFSLDIIFVAVSGKFRQLCPTKNFVRRKILFNEKVLTEIG